ncbi:MAG TPA: DUF1820 family protein [Geobacteraceae bacterium]
MMKKRLVYRVIFTNQNKVYEIYARKVTQGELYGFVEVEGVLFGEKSSLVLDPGEEQLKHEFSGVKRSYLPFSSIIRIDEVEKEGTAKLLHLAGNGEGAPSSTPFPFPGKGPGKA